MLFAANAVPHDNILGLVEAGVSPLVTVSETVTIKEVVKINDVERIKEYTCSKHAVVLPIAKCDFIDYMSLHLRTSAASSTFFAPPTRTTGAMLGPAARRFFEQMVAGTRRLHDLGIAHLDLKLENMLISLGSDATLMISDFGMSKEVGVAGRSGTPIIKGTEDYAPPEVYAASAAHAAAGQLSPQPPPYDTFLVNGDTNAFAVDVWTLGVCLATLVIGEILKPGYLTKSKQEVFAEMRAAQRSGANGANGLREACSAFRYTAALSRFNRLDPSLQSLLDSMLRVDPKARPTLAKVEEKIPSVAWIPQLPPPPAQEPQPRSLAAAPPAVDAPQHRSLAATAPAAALSVPAFRGLSAAADAEEPRYNACSAAPTAAAYRSMSAAADEPPPTAAPSFRSMSAAAEEAEMPPIGRCIARTLV
jgi:serine/threonine protein kinase